MTYLNRVCYLPSAVGVTRNYFLTFESLLNTKVNIVEHKKVEKGGGSWATGRTLAHELGHMLGMK